jgi:hypothetical protein
MNKKGQSDLSGWKNLKKLLNQLDKTQIETGFFPESKYGADNDNLQVAQVAAWQEWGTYDGEHIPPRPFMRVDFKYKMTSQKMKLHIITATNNVLQGQAVKQALKPLAARCQDLMMDAIEERSTPRNSEETISQKGFDDPLIEFGDMRDAVKAKITRG